ncbi:NFX1-type zinc finger-containing protein 1-like protein [Dinothrombium tinctorium]|uniref:NFX1-type zinc finger-containing protein 1-like protein n=1 Tax=Dinothrombium tinctorium TaxID=1965070 RepID=A0A3S3RTU5_9ACAR|nr:NFX1-type zinc finger-containing protein 1-like protein [Dinothrombium tinctorium]RWS06613.1 NFX1-type zinc finger-containing protein 1-like protein [Dinothrombium tinctorium]RWS06636.1 NFX1-type zinc finger-containing protein 1-like protein [Dinothrombium tinctorium]
MSVCEDKTSAEVSYLCMLKAKFPSRFSQFSYSLIVIQVIDTILRINCFCKINVDTMKSLIDLKEDIKQLKTFYIERGANPNSLKIKEPPNDFRTLTITPTVEDLKTEKPFLPRILVRQQYKNVDHYLDTHFRLLREDFLTSLRSGINEFLKESKKQTKFKNAYVYYNVKIVEMRLSQNLYACRMQFQKPKRILSTKNKRLENGALLCLSWDHFENSFIFARIQGTKNEQFLQNRLFDAFIEPCSQELFFNIISRITDVSMTAIQPTAYFEAYRHNLATLQQLNNENFPMRDYIIDLNKNVRPPSYLTQQSTYDLSFFVQPLKLDDKVRMFIYDENDAKEEKKRAVERLQKIEVMNELSWPPCHELNLDESQSAALRHALTKEVAIIQGPPGTGKTFIGLKIVETLIKNSSIWNKNEKSPILVICYTNHALDQFLEGVSRFCKDIVRIGGRCKLSLKKFRLNEIKKSKVYKLFPIRYEINECLEVINHFQKKCNLLLESVVKAKKQLLTSDVIDIIKTKLNIDQVHSLSSSFYEFKFHKDLSEWLGLSSPSFKQLMNDKNNSDDESESDFCNEEESDFDDDDFFINEEFFDESSPIIESNHSKRTELSKVQKLTMKYVKQQLKSNDSMQLEEAKTITDVQSLSMKNRWRLYRLWLQLYIEEILIQVEQLQKDNVYQEKVERLNALRTLQNQIIVSNTNVVGMTTTGAAKYRRLIDCLKPKIVIVEEAAEVLESHIITSLTEKIKHLILIGDHIQLKPKPVNHELAVKHNLEVSLFEKLILNRFAYVQLKIQYRMHPKISRMIVPTFYPELHDHESVRRYPRVKGVTKRLFFLNHRNFETESKTSTSLHNNHECQFIVRFCKFLLLQGYQQSQITILAMYSAQWLLLKNELQNFLLYNVRVTVVDNFQGEENDIIILSLVRSNQSRKIGFLNIANRINVAFSRAKLGFYAVGNFDHLRNSSPEIWEPLVTEMYRSDLIGENLEIYCQNHPETKMYINHGFDFNRYPEGCCLLECRRRLSCGHICPKTCHIQDSEHQQIKCSYECLSILCDRQHRCQKQCHYPEKCGSCLASIEVKIPKCGHTVSSLCSRTIDEIICSHPCDKLLKCGHKCKAKCGENCDSFPCEEEVQTELPCGHSSKQVKCCFQQNMKKLLEICKEPCRRELKCGHICGGSCSKCRQGKFHVECNEKCKRLLICGHECPNPCAQNCPPCERLCENSCKHGTSCKHKCGIACPSCKMQCGWKCSHMQCTALCSEPCNRKICSNACDKLLKCNHQCVGLCGDICPNICRICDKEKLEELFFGNENDPNARFTQLLDCQHVFEVKSLQRWIEQNSSTESGIKLLRCPKCAAVIRRSILFNFQVQKVIKDINQVKAKSNGTLAHNLRTTHFLQNKCRDIRHRLGNKKMLNEQIAICADQVERIVESQAYALKFEHLLYKSELLKIENVLNIVQEACSLFLTDFGMNEDKTFAQRMSQFLLYIEKEFKSSLQQIDDVNWELKTLTLFRRYLWLKKNYNCKLAKVRCLFAMAAAYFKRFTPLTSEDLDKVQQYLNKAFQLQTGSKISLEERDQIVKGMNFAQQGHWYKCPNNHIYCITECGGATETGVCPECKASIGGENHRLLDSNAIAGEMDGAIVAAYDYNSLYF